MIVTDWQGKKRLEIFHNFSVDSQLKRHNKEQSKILSLQGPEDSISSGNIFIRSEGTNNGFITSTSVMMEGNSGEKTLTKNPGVWQKIKSWFNKPPKKKNALTVFNAIFNNIRELKKYEDRSKDYDVAIERARLNGQYALAEHLESRKSVFLLESQLLIFEFKKYITEDQVIEFADNCEKCLRLDWIKNFARPIPKEVLDEKMRADEQELFDNYVILHYDPENRNSKMTKEDIEKAKDPILFGVRKESTSLYFIGDWKDEYCDLTFDDLIREYGEEALTLQ
jgi:hypothetical protein